MEGDILYISTVGSPRYHVGPRAEPIRRSWHASEPSFGTYTIVLRVPPAAFGASELPYQSGRRPLRAPGLLVQTTFRTRSRVTTHEPERASEPWSRSDLSRNCGLGQMGASKPWEQNAKRRKYAGRGKVSSIENTPSITNIPQLIRVGN